VLGDSLIRIGTYAIVIFAIFILFGEILSSAIDIALAFQSGLILPSITVAIGTLVLTRLTARSLREPNETRFLSISAWVLTGYLSLIAGLIVISYGLTVSMFVASLIFMAMYSLRQPIEIDFNFSEFYRQVKGTIDLALLGTSVKRWSKRAYQNLMTITFPAQSIEDVLEAVRDYPELAFLVIRYESLFVLIAPRNKWKRVCTILEEAGIRVFEKGSRLLTWTILYQLPIICEEHGLKSSDYSIAYDIKSVDQVPSSWPVDSTLYSTPNGLYMILRKSDGSDVYTKELPSGCEARIVAGKDYSVVKQSKRGGTT
jgi:hypothetical protein